MKYPSFLRLPEELLLDVFVLVADEQANEQRQRKTDEQAPPFSQYEAHPFPSVAQHTPKAPPYSESEDIITPEWQMHRRLVALGKVREIL